VIASFAVGSFLALFSVVATVLVRRPRHPLLFVILSAIGYLGCGYSIILMIYAGWYWQVFIACLVVGTIYTIPFVIVGVLRELPLELQRRRLTRY
jgi:CHASE2 domain-containing sensor protein